VTYHDGPKSELALGLLEILSNTGFELQVWFCLKDTESGQLCRRPILVIESGKIEALMSLEALVRDNPCSEDKAQFVTFQLFCFLPLALLVKSPLYVRKY